MKVMKNQMLTELFNSKKDNVEVMEFYNECEHNAKKYTKGPFKYIDELSSMRLTVDYILAEEFGMDSLCYPAYGEELDLGLKILFNTSFQEMLDKRGLASQI